MWVIEKLEKYCNMGTIGKPFTILAKSIMKYVINANDRGNLLESGNAYLK